ncbi:hypothetical protein PROSTU_04400 [Providencia stuartii ATCC 25827]|uniref:PhoP regulatory network protein YrbL n=2 Tax=Morganellaceae TaxID=1903414 RepID=A0AA86YVK1_PROST|nr:hypothetical protein PROSTU_04400 [Providencia stuartii ATCC 25827]
MKAAIAMNRLFNKRIHLPSSLLIASGRQRACYQHPDYSDLCIKVHHSDRDDKETLREVRYYKLLARKNKNVTTVSQYYGTQETDRGLGYIFQLIKDKNGNTSQTLDYYLSNKSVFLKHKSNMKIAYSEFKKKVFSESIVSMTLKTYNIVYQLGHSPHGRFFIIDNLGSANLIPLDYFSSTLAKSTLKRRFLDFEKRLYKDYKIKL